MEQYYRDEDEKVYVDKATLLFGREWARLGPWGASWLGGLSLEDGVEVDMKEAISVKRIPDIKHMKHYLLQEELLITDTVW